MMIGILSSIAIPQFMSAADKAKQKEATGIVAALVKAATAYNTEYGSLPLNAGQLEEYAKFQKCTHTDRVARGGAACKGTTPAKLADEDIEFHTSSGNYFVEFTGEGTNADGFNIFQVKANPNGGAYRDNGSAVIGCFNPVDSVSEIFEHTATDDPATGRGAIGAYRPC